MRLSYRKLSHIRLSLNCPARIMLTRHGRFIISMQLLLVSLDPFEPLLQLK